MEESAWGKIAIINLYGCNEYIKNPDKIKEFFKKIMNEINMEPHGPVYIDRFGDGDLEGYSAKQFIKTSSITSHFDETQNRAFIDIFSCKDFDGKRAKSFCKDFFKAKKSKMRIFTRG